MLGHDGTLWLLVSAALHWAPVPFNRIRLSWIYTFHPLRDLELESLSEMDVTQMLVEVVEGNADGLAIITEQTVEGTLGLAKVLVDFSHHLFRSRDKILQTMSLSTMVIVN